MKDEFPLTSENLMEFNPYDDDNVAIDFSDNDILAEHLLISYQDNMPPPHLTPTPPL